MIKWIDGFGREDAEFRVHYLLEEYLDKIYPLQLNEALLTAFKKKNYDLCNKLIEAGADKKILQFHSAPYGWNQFSKEVKETNKDFWRAGVFWRKKDSVIIREILKELGNPQEKVPPVFHVTGSNGKGSTCAFLKAILENNGYKIHMFTSPAIIRSNENYILAGNEITDELYHKYLSLAKKAYDKIVDRQIFKTLIDEANKEDKLSEESIKKEGVLDWTMVIPAIILAFSENKADATIMEVITGGEFDLTNVFDKKITIATIINTIIFGDNHATLPGFGGSIEGVASTKSRLAKEGIPIISTKQEDSVMKIIKQTAIERNC